jgi:DNA polymerase III delta prime subunit
MLEKVWAIWISGVLQASLPHDILLELNLTERSTMVARTLDLFVQRQDLAERLQAPGTRLVDVFDRLDRALLILGAPGAGKTTLLLELARDLLQRAAEDPEQPIPVVFPLSSWAKQRRPLALWLVDALSEQYDVPRKLGQAWIAADAILPLLDGLDEITPEHRTACIEAINAFRHDHGLLPLVVCSRMADYEALDTRLRLQGALVVQPLMPQQVDSYFTQVGAPLAAVRQTLQEDPALGELLDTPLMLTIVTLAYAGESGGALRMGVTLGERRQYLFAAYVDRMFQRRSATIHYHRQQSERFLAWLARQMTQHNQTVFYMERMQPYWLPQEQRWIPTRGAGLLAGLLSGLTLGLFGLVSGSLPGVVWGLIMGGLIGWIKGRSKDIKPIESTRLLWPRFFYALSRSVTSLPLVVCWLLGLGSLFMFGWRGLLFWLVLGLTMALLWLLFGFSDGFGSQIATKKTPNEGIYRSARMAVINGLCSGLVGMVIWLMTVLVHELVLGVGWVRGLGESVDPTLGLMLLSVVLLFSFNYGGLACLQHLLLRLVLRRNGSAPRHYVDFLDYAAERIFLRKVGGGYIFIHQLLQDYFATLYPSSILPSSGQASMNK